jgi:hypothetical protein
MLPSPNLPQPAQTPALTRVLLTRRCPQFLPLPLGSTPLHIAAARVQGSAALAILEHYVSALTAVIW